MKNEYQAKPNPEQTKKTLWILWAALLASMGGYAALGLIIRSQSPAISGEPSYTTLIIPLFIMALLQTAFVTTFWSKLLTPPHGELSAYSAPFIIRMALSESIGILGLLLFMTGASIEILFGFLAWGVLLQLSLAPTENSIRAFRETYGAKK